MYLFFIIFLSLYGGMHAYAFLKARAAMHFGLVAGVGIGMLMAMMVLAPFLVRYAEKQGLEAQARVFSYAGYIWLGIIFLFFSSSVTIDFYRLAVQAAGWLMKKDVSYLLPSAKASFYVPLALALSISVYGYFEAQSIRTERLTIKTTKLPLGVDRVRVAQISDVHIGLIVRGDRLGRILDAVRRESPDILISTGDLVDGQIDGLVGPMRLLKNIEAPMGKFAVVGNHEYYAGIDKALAFAHGAGFQVLRGEAVHAGGINIAGVDDIQGKSYGMYRYIPEAELLGGVPSNRFTLFLKHRPVVEKSSAGAFDLQLSGHVHKGQIFPFRVFTRMFFGFVAGRFQLPGGSELYVSRGAGTWGPPIRFLSPPEVTIIDIVRQ